MTLEIAVFPDPSKPDRPCMPAGIISGLMSEIRALGRLSMLEECVMDQALHGGPRGNCHDASLALLMDLYRAARSDGWRLLNGTYKERPKEKHSWLEFDGWAVDTGRGRILIAEANDYRKHTGAVSRRSLDADQVRRMNPRKMKRMFTSPGVIRF